MKTAGKVALTIGVSAIMLLGAISTTMAADKVAATAKQCYGIPFTVVYDSSTNNWGTKVTPIKSATLSIAGTQIKSQSQYFVFGFSDIGPYTTVCLPSETIPNAIGTVVLETGQSQTLSIPIPYSVNSSIGYNYFLLISTNSSDMNSAMGSNCSSMGQQGSLYYAVCWART